MVSKMKYKTKIYILLSLIILCISGMTFLLLAIPTIKIKGEKIILLDVFSTYEELGATAKTPLKNETSQIKIEGEVNTNQVGVYEITYSVTVYGLKTSAKRMVKVVDRKAPEITLIGEDTVTICPNAEYQEEGYSAYDEYDGDLTDEVQVTKEENRFLYKVEDSSKNQTTKIRTLQKEDKEGPTITLKGEQTMSIYLGSSYEEPGYTVSDNCDSNIEVTVEGTVDTSKVGTYQIVYQANDQSNNTTSITRTVTVKEKPVSFNSTIYLTFDDGPSSITPQILDILKKYNIKATFFVINHDSSYDAYIKRAYEEGHTIAVHSYTHNYKTIYTSVNAYLNDFSLMREKIYKITGSYTNLFRFPGGSSNTVSRFNRGIMTTLTSTMEKKGYVYFDWNVDSDDAGSAKNSETVYNNVVNSVGKFHSYVVLMHDFEGNYKTLNALENIIINLKNRGYQFDKLSETSYKAHHVINN